MRDKKMLLEVWKTWNYLDVIASFVFLPSLIFLWHLGYNMGFWILLILVIISKISLAFRVSKLEKILKI